MTEPRTDADLLEIIRKQAEQIEQLLAKNKTLREENARLWQHTLDLERQQRQYTAPYSRGTRKASPKTAGRRAGEGQFTYKCPPAREQEDAVIDIAVSNTCTACGYVGELIFKQHDRAWISDLLP